MIDIEKGGSIQGVLAALNRLIDMSVAEFRTEGGTLLVGGHGRIGDLADLTNIGTLFAFILVCLGVNVLRRVAPDLPRPFRVPFVPVFPILGVILCVVLMLSLPVMTWIRFVVWLGIGLTIYFLYSVRHSKLRRGLDAGITEDVPPPLIKT